MQIRWTTATRSVGCAFVVLLVSTLLRGRTNHFQVFGKKDKVLLLTAHPDDETFFFSPTLAALSESEPDVFVVSLSTGNAKGLGDVRRGEFTRALDVFGVREGRGGVWDHPGLQDNKTAHWDKTLIARELYSFVVDNNISTILTFDSVGITNHPNHRSVFAGAVQLVFNSPWQLPQAQRLPPKLFALRSQPGTMTRHIGPLAAFSSYLDLMPGSNEDGDVHFTVTASLADYFTALRAMCEHKSQLRFTSIPFVKGLFSRYLWVNEWVQVTVEPSI